ncbi:Sfi1 spindle body protein-domain-containing protein [Pisolithus thermaeus]|nr:Sfi1 spindle body protein-domain-containing protein [Pisolithus thermaeus]
MFGFRPCTTSSPAKSLVLAAAGTSDISRTSATSKSELQALSPLEVEFLDAVVRRIPSNATSFLAGLKAYNDELRDRGLDSQTETVHYGRLLELCKLRGPSWQVKWDDVKKLYGYANAPSGNGSTSRIKATPQPTAARHLLQTLKRPLARSTTPPGHGDDDDDVFTLPSHQHQHEMQSTDTTEEERSSVLAEDDTPTHVCVDQPRQALGLTRLLSTPPACVANPILPPSLVRQATPRPQSRYLEAIRQVPAWGDMSDDTNVTLPSPSTTPPSYRAATRTTANNEMAAPASHIPHPLPIQLPKSEALVQVPAHPRERRGSVINEEDAWRKIKIARDEEDADKFREFKLLERCWETWILGYQWVITTGEQVAEARDKVIIGSAIRRWHNRTALLLDRDERAASVANVRRLRVAMAMWRWKLKERRQLMWRNAMRAKMKTVREKREYNIQRDAWSQWRHAYCCRLAEMRFMERLVGRFFFHWKAKLANLDRLETSAADFLERPTCSAVVHAWKLWRRALRIRNAAQMVTANAGLRVKREVVDIWKKRTRDHQLAREFHDVCILKRLIRSWKAARDRIRATERRADKYLARQDNVLIRAVTRVWKARERGRLLERVRALRLLKDAWSTWRERIRQTRHLHDYAIAFSMRSSSYIAASALRKWQHAYNVYQNRHTFAIQHHLARVQFNALLTWRLQLRMKFKLMKHARIVEKFLIQRRVLKLWKFKLEAKKRLDKLKALEIRKLQALWKRKANRIRSLRVAEQQVTNRIAARLITDALVQWTNRVIEIKLRELEVEQKYSHALKTFAFTKWKNVCLRHVEDLSLMESHLDIKRAETMRRVFHRWLALARARHQRRTILREKELTFVRASLQATWDRWREKFIKEKLRPMAHQVALRSQKNLLFRAFGIWLVKTRSLPAIRFHAFRLKQRSWQKWRAAMPQALQAKKAREMHTKAVLSRAFEKWHQGYKVRTHLKEIARARYLRLPGAIPGQSASASKVTGPLVPVTTRNAFPRRALRADTETEESDAGPSRPAIRSATRTPRAGIASLLSTRTPAEPVPRARPKLSSRGVRDSSPARSMSSAPAPRPKFGVTRNPSPARSTTSYAGGSSPTRSVAPVSQEEPERSRLWQELRQVRMRSRPPTERSRSPVPS